MTHEARTYIMTEDERTAALKRLAEIAEAHAAGAIVAERARHEIARVIAPVKRRTRRAMRRAYREGEV